MNDRVTVFILAAGLGERLRPLTSRLPKPLLPIAGRPVLEMVLERVNLLRPRAVGVNVHYLANTVEEWAAAAPCARGVTLFREDPVLGTGGALQNAGSMLSTGTFLTHNADIVSSADLHELLERHRSGGNLATLAVHDLPRFNNVVVDDAGRFAGIAPRTLTAPGVHTRAFMGIAVYEPAFLDFLPPGASSVVDAWLRAAGAGHRVATADLSGAYWTDIGTPADFASVVTFEMRSRGETVFLHPSSSGCRGVAMDGYLVVEGGCSLGTDVSLRNCIVLPGTSIPSGASHRNRIIGPGFSVDLDEADFYGLPPKTDTLPIGTGGSDRQFFRVRRAGTTSVLMRSRPGDPDLLRQIEYARFFAAHGLPVAPMRQADPAAGEVLFEDLGDLSLFSWLKCGRSERELRTVYGQAVRIAADLHARLTPHLDECPSLRERVFDYEHLRWETAYFMERFVSALSANRSEDPSSLGHEFHLLASAVDALPKTVIHRDLQCQNIMVTPGGALSLIDYQGARVGPPAYDVASLLWDPYHRLPDSLREELLADYVNAMRQTSPLPFAEQEFREGLALCRLQRHMQALGAFGFLSLVKGKRHFLRHVPEGLRLLEEDVQGNAGVFPALFRLVLSVRESGLRREREGNATGP